MFNKTPTRTAQKEATAKAVLDAARAEFERVGYEAANIRAIAARAKVAPGTVIHHHGDKRELLHAALFEDLDATLRKALADLGEGPIASPGSARARSAAKGGAESIEKQLGKLTRAVFRYYEKRPALSRTLLKESLFADPPWAQKFTAQVAMCHAAIAKLVQQAIERGELRADTNPALLGAAYFSFFYFALIGWVQGGLPNPVQLVESLIQQHLRSAR